MPWIKISTPQMTGSLHSEKLTNQNDGFGFKVPSFKIWRHGFWYLLSWTSGVYMIQSARISTSHVQDQ